MQFFSPSFVLTGPFAVALVVTLVLLLVALGWLLLRRRSIVARFERLARDLEDARAEAAAARGEVAGARREISAARGRVEQSSWIARLTREIAGGDGSSASVANALCGAVQGALGGDCHLRLLGADGALLPLSGDEPLAGAIQSGLAAHVLEKRQRVSFTGAPPAELPASDAERAAYAAAPPQAVTLLPLACRDTPLGVVEVRRAPETVAADDEVLIEALADVAASSLAGLREREDLRQDLAERERSAAEHERAAAELREAVHSKDVFMATVAHELRTPLNAILGWSHILKAGVTDETTRARALEAVIRNGDRQSRLIGDLLDLSRVTAGQLELDLQAGVELAPVVRAALDTVRPLAEEKGVKLRSGVDAEAGPLTADPHRLQQVVWNLLVNAVKFTPAGGEVAVQVERADDGGVAFEIADTGPGIPDALLPHVFDRFKQGVGSQRTHGGLGLGLAIVRHLVELHGGSVSVHNNAPNPGATFVVRVPLVAPARELEGRSPDATAPLRVVLPSLDGLRILVVDDEPEARELVASILREHGAEAEAVSCAADALAHARQACPDVLVSDLDMAGEDGCALVRQLRALPASQGGAAVAVALTGHSRPEDRIAALLAGFQGHLAKPVEPAELVALIGALSERVRTPASAA